MDSLKWSALLAHWSMEDGPRYVRVAAALRGHIQRGQLAPAEALPAERQLAALLGLSRSTVVAAYDDLAAQGWVTRKRGSGTHVSQAAPRQAGLLALRSPLPPFQLGHTPPLQEIDLTVAVPLLSAAHREQLLAASAHAFEESVYHPLGLPALRALVAEQYTQAGLSTTTEQVVITTGAQQAIALVANCLLRRGDGALLETPTYFGAIDVFRAAGAHLSGVPVTKRGVMPSAFEERVKQDLPRLAFLTPTFQNPTSTVMPPRAREGVAECIARFDLPTIEDDTLIDLSFGPTAPPRLSCYAPSAPIINVGSLSKLFWAGLRVGWMRVPPCLSAPLTQTKTLADFGSSLPSQVIALKLLQDLPSLREQRRAQVQPGRDLLVALTRQYLPDWSFDVPQGGQFLWVQLPTRHASGFIHHARQYGVRLFAGASMGVSDLPDSYLRLPFTLEPAQLREAALRLQVAWHDFQRRQGAERLV